MARGNRREPIFADDTDRRFFLRTLGEAAERTGWRVHAWVLMSNHYHCLLETPEANLVAGMQWLQNAYTRRFNTRHQLWGRLFGDRYKAVLTEGRRGEYYGTLLDYIHLNPVRAGLIRPQRGESVLDYPWSSVAEGYALPDRAACPLAGLRGRAWGSTIWATIPPVAAALCRGSTNGPGRKRPGNAGVPPSAGDGRQSHLRRGWYWGSQAFAEKMLALAARLLSQGKKNRTYRSGAVVKAHGERRAEEAVREGLAAAGLAEDALAGLPGSDPRKVQIARGVREQTTVSMSWIAERLHMRSAANVSQILRRHRERSNRARPRLKPRPSVKIC
ncbi:MAG: transposase [Chthoniobacter sp.]